MLGTTLRQAVLHLAPSVLLRPLSTSPWLAARGRGRYLEDGLLLVLCHFRYLKDGSNKQELSGETRELIQKARDTDDRTWQVGSGDLLGTSGGFG